MAIYFYLKKDHLVKILTILILIFTFINIFLNKTFLLGPYRAQNIFIDLFSDLGGLFGFSMFIILLAITGLLITWKRKKFFLAYIVLPILLAFSIYQTSLLIYLNFFVIFLASFGFIHFLNKKWKIEIIKNIFLFLLILGILFSTLTSLIHLSELPPTSTLERNFVKINEKVAPNQTIFSHPQDSYLIEYFAKRPAFIHYHDTDFKIKKDLTDQIFESTYIKETFPLLEQTNISYIYLPPETKADLPPDRGLLFLLQNERFKRIYKRNDIELWKFD
ncbi:hypothetical protein GOV03_02935 [Candidatus Woesearchaeota archaeon]|nr:hypothetical protein [Candidatus Woesearchaeota archaeon]